MSTSKAKISWHLILLNHKQVIIFLYSKSSHGFLFHLGKMSTFALDIRQMSKHLCEAHPLPLPIISSATPPTISAPAVLASLLPLELCTHLFNRPQIFSPRDIPELTSKHYHLLQVWGQTSPSQWGLYWSYT